MSNRDLNGKPRELPPNSNHFDAYPCNVEHYHTETNRMNVETDDPGSKLDEVGEGLEETNGDNLDKIKGPIDHGWAWVILVASTCEMFIIIGMMRCYGIFFLEFQEKFNSTSSVTSLISTLQNLVYSISGLFVMTVGLQFVSSRKFIVLGGLLTGLGYIITAVLEDITAVLLINGAFVGCTLSFVYGPMMATLNSYFVRHLGLANSIMGCGVSLGGLILAPLFTHLFKEYGYRGAFLIAAGLYFNIIVFGLLFRPVDFNTKKKEKGDTGENIEFEREPPVINCNRHAETNNEQFERPVNIDANDRYEDELETVSFLEKGGTIVFRNREQKELEREHSVIDEAEWRLFETNTMKHVSVDLHTSLHSLYNTVKDLQGERQITHEDANQRKSRIPRNVKNLVRTIFDFAILKESLFLYYLLCTVFLCSGNASTPFYVAPLANEIGMDEDETAFVLMVVNVVDLFARIAIGFVSDRNWLRRSNMVALASCVLGVTCCFVHFVNCFVSLVIFAIVVGLLQGVYWSLFAVVIVDYLTLEKLKSALGFCGLVQGLSIGCAIPIAGYLKDTTDTYVTSYTFVGGLLMTGAILTALLPFIQRLLLRRADKTVS